MSQKEKSALGGRGPGGAERPQFDWRERLGTIIDHAHRLGPMGVKEAMIGLLYEYDALKVEAGDAPAIPPQQETPSIKRRDTPESAAFWDFVERTAREWREQMPDWAKSAADVSPAPAIHGAQLDDPKDALYLSDLAADHTAQVEAGSESVEHALRTVAVLGYERALPGAAAFLCDRLRALRDQWRQQATLIDTFHATMGTGYKVCADELDALLTGAGEAP